MQCAFNQSCDVGGQNPSTSFQFRFIDCLSCDMTRKNLRGAVVGTVTLTWLALLTAGQSPPTGPALKRTPSGPVAQRLNKKSGSLRRRSPGVLLPGTVRLLSDDRSVERTGGVARDLVKQAL